MMAKAEDGESFLEGSIYGRFFIALQVSREMRFVAQYAPWRVRKWAYFCFVEPV